MITFESRAQIVAEDSLKRRKWVDPVQGEMLTKMAPRRGSLGALRLGQLVNEDPAEILGAEPMLWGGIALGWAGKVPQ